MVSLTFSAPLVACLALAGTVLGHGFTAVVSGPDMLTGNLDALKYTAAGGKTPAGNPLTSGMAIRYHNRTHAFVVQNQDGAELDTPVTGNNQKNCGKQNEGGQVNIPQGIAALYKAGGNAFPSSLANGTVYAIWHQVVADGGGALKAQISNDATAQNFQSLNMEIQAPGNNNNYRAPQYKQTNGQGANYTYSFNLPPNTKCTGGPDNDSCLIKVTNNNFGGCFMVTPYGAKAAPAAAAAPAVDPAAATPAVASAGVATVKPVAAAVVTDVVTVPAPAASTPVVVQKAAVAAGSAKKCAQKKKRSAF